MLTATARASLQRVTALPLRPLAATRAPVLTAAAHARPFTATAWAGSSAKERAMEAKKDAVRDAAREKKIEASEKRKADKEAKAKTRDELRAKKIAEGAEKKKKKRAPTPEEKAKAEVRELKARALLKEEPKKVPDTAWKVYVSQELKGASVGQDLAGSTKAVSEKFKNLSSSELETLQSTADTNRASNASHYKIWVETYTPAQVRDANLARAALGRKTDKTHRKISDERVPRRPSSAYSLFVKERWAAGGLEGAATKASAELAREWRTLPDEEKKVYTDEASKELAKYAEQMGRILEESS